MADFRAIAAVSRTLQRLLQDRMVSDAAVTVAPPDQTITGFDAARVNLYPIQVLESAALKNDHRPGHAHSASYGRPPLSLNLRYVMTSHADSEVHPSSDLTAQEILGDAMLVMHSFANRLHGLTLVNLAPPELAEPVLDPVLDGEIDQLHVVLHPVDLEEVTKIWSALSNENFRRTVIYEVTTVQLEHPQRPRVAPPVAERRLFAAVARRPVIERAFVTPAAGEPETELRVRIGEAITIVARHTAADRLFVQFGDLPAVAVALAPGGRITITVPDDAVQTSLDPPESVSVPEALRLQPGTLRVRLIAEVEITGVAGAHDHGRSEREPRRYFSNLALLLLVPRMTGVQPAIGDASTILTVTGSRLWHPAVEEAIVVVGDVAIPISPPGPGDAWSAPSAESVAVPIAAAALAPGEYPVAVIVDGARSRDAGFTFRLEP